MYKLLIKFKGRDRKIKDKILKEEILKTLNLQDEISNLIGVELGQKILILELESKKFLNKLINEITKLKLENKKLEILDLNLDIQEIKLEKSKRILENRKIVIEFVTPTVFKIGSNFKENYSNYLFFSWLLRKVNKSLVKEEKINIPREEIEKIVIVENRLESVEIQLKEFVAPAFKGKIELDFKNIEDNFIENFEKILNYGLKNGVGYKNENGYGKIRIYSN